MNPAVQNLIRDENTYHIQSALQTGHGSGMITMEISLKARCDRGLITYKDALGAALDPRELHASWAAPTAATRAGHGTEKSARPSQRRRAADPGARGSESIQDSD